MHSSLLLGLVLGSASVGALPTTEKRDVDTRYPYNGPAIPIGDWMDPTVNGNGKGFVRLTEPPAVHPKHADPDNNVNVISTAFVPGGINIHYQTPFGLGQAPSVLYGPSSSAVATMASGVSSTYDRTPPCSLYAKKTQCTQFFHNVQITGLQPGTTYYYKIPAANGTTESDVLNFTTARAAGDTGSYRFAVLNDMGYTNAKGTHKMLNKAADEGIAFAWHGGDISYADDNFYGTYACSSTSRCSNGTNTFLPPGDEPKAYLKPLPAGEIANQGGPWGGDISTIYESNWDLWQNWMNKLTKRVPYMTVPGNHEAACVEGDGPNGILTAYLNNNEANSTAVSDLSYYSCPPSQRNFTAYQYRFRMPGAESGGVSNFWYSFDYGLVHFVGFDGETDFPNSPELSFADETKGVNNTPTEAETRVTNSGPFGTLEGGPSQYNNVTAYGQYQWLAKDLAAVNRTKTPWVLAMSHRPMYSSQTATYQVNMRASFEQLFISHGVDLYMSGHIHWYERMYPMSPNSTIDSSSIVNHNTYYTNAGVSMTHVVNGMAGNIESHSTLGTLPLLPITNVLNNEQYGFSEITVMNKTALMLQYIRGDGSGVGDTLTLLKRPVSS